MLKRWEERLQAGRSGFVLRINVGTPVEDILGNLPVNCMWMWKSREKQGPRFPGGNQTWMGLQNHQIQSSHVADGKMVECRGGMQLPPSHTGSQGHIREAPREFVLQLGCMYSFIGSITIQPLIPLTHPATLFLFSPACAGPQTHTQMRRPGPSWEELAV